MVEVVEKIEVREIPDIMPEPPEKPPPLDLVGETLLKARDYIREHGWCQNAFMDYEDECAFPSACLVGSLNWALGLAIDEDDPVLIWGHVERLGFVSPMQAANWNDTTDRTQQEVEERLERAAYNL